MTIPCSCCWLQRNQRDKLGFCAYRRVVLPALALLETKGSLHTRNRLSGLFSLLWLNFLSNFVLSLSQFPFRSLILPSTFSLTSQSVAMEIQLWNFTDGLGRRQKIDWVGNEPSFVERARLRLWLYCYQAWESHWKQSPDFGFAAPCLGLGCDPACVWQHWERV